MCTCPETMTYTGGGQAGGTIVEGMEGKLF